MESNLPRMVSKRAFRSPASYSYSPSYRLLIATDTSMLIVDAIHIMSNTHRRILGEGRDYVMIMLAALLWKTEHDLFS